MIRALAAFVLTVALLPQQAASPTFRARIDLVQVDVVVVDENGDPVRGLKASDFGLVDRKKPQEIATFDEVSHERAGAAAAAFAASVRRDVADNQTAQSDRLVVMVIDDLHIYKERTDRAKEIARKVLLDLGAQSSMAVLFTSQDHSTQVTADQSRLRAAVETLKGRQSTRRPHRATDAQTGARIGAEDSMEVALAKVQQSQDTKVQDFFDNLTQYKTLQDAAKMLGGGDARRKAFVLLSEGIGKDLSGIFGAMAPPGEAPGGGAEYAAGNLEALTHVAATPYHDQGLVDMMEAMRRANIATYAIDPRGKVESKDLARECFPPPVIPDPCSNDLADWHSMVRLAQHGLEITSAASGGFAVTNTDDFTSGIQRIVDDLDHYYLLGFYPTDSKGKGYRPLDVRIAGHPDWRLRFRRGYLPGGPPPPPASADSLIALSAGILPKTDLPLRLTAIALPGAGPATRVVLGLEVSAPRAALQEADGKVRDTLKYEVLVVDEKKARVRSVSGLEGRLTLSPARGSEPAPDTVTYQVAEVIDIVPGRYELRVSAQSAKLAKGGSVYLDVEVPDFRAAPIVIGGLSIGYADGARVPIAPKAVPPVLPFPPSLDRSFTPADTLRMYFEASVRPGAPRAVPVVEVLSADGRVVRSPSPSVAGGETLRVEASIPLAGLASGAYVLRATVGGVTREIGFVVN